MFLFKLIRFLIIFGSFVRGIFGFCFKFGICSIFWVKIVEECNDFFLNILLGILGEFWVVFIKLFIWLLILVVFKFKVVVVWFGFIDIVVDVITGVDIIGMDRRVVV